MDDHGNEVLNLGSFTLLPQHVVRLILNREELKADEFSKFQVAFVQFFMNPSNTSLTNSYSLLFRQPSCGVRSILTALESLSGTSSSQVL